MSMLASYAKNYYQIGGITIHFETKIEMYKKICKAEYEKAIKELDEELAEYLQLQGENDHHKKLFGKEGN